MSTDGADPPVTVDILPDGAGNPPPWDPQPGPEVGLLNLPAGARNQIVEEACRILRRCVDPNGPPQTQTGLAMGYVQSGKTTSFTTVTALARDNGYRLVIVIAGTTEILFEQNRDRIIESLQLESRPRSTPWRHITQPHLRNNSHIQIRDTLAQWDVPNAMPEERRTVLVTVMKHHRHLQNLIDVLQQVNLQNVPTLLIDDEGDQAGLNTQVNQGDESTTYRRLLDLKTALPLHSYLQYTATPQAPLLINLVDVLSPTFAEILTPGAGYVGGADFFLRNPTLIRDIPVAQVPTNRNVLNAPPATLTEAMQLFYVGVAIGYINGQPEQNCSMMVHPSQRTDPHRQFHGWVTTARTDWLQIIDLPDDDPDKIDLLAQFQRAYDDLATTTPNIPTFAQVVSQLRRSISLTEITELNTRGNRRTPQINWGQSYSWILVGGQSMDRGFTVEGLTVTYMPRSLGMGNADTVQQRARFFGYKRPYLGLCRIFVGQDVRRAFRSYVEHEEDVRGELATFAQTQRPLWEWRREFFLSRQLRPTRDNVIDVAYQRMRFGDEWVYPNGPHDTADAVTANAALFNQFRAAHPFGPYNGLDLRQNSRRNQVIENIPLQTVHEELLTRYRVTRLEDSQQFGAMLRLIQLYLIDNPNATCTVFLMAEGNTRRRDYQDDQIVQLFQGRQYAQINGARGISYPGDREVRGANGITIQMGYLDLGQPNALVGQNIPHLAVWVPSSMARDTLSQPQGG
ncbi:Z1 domain-containing protein [Schlesneria sp. DSM 10557]|uniref:Z1 domain-containing protein n=1 Tax=Schlesneria sp. DSM 10557 TaxID=3044399 RepID=UPI0035A02173